MSVQDLESAGGDPAPKTGQSAELVAPGQGNDFELIFPQTELQATSLWTDNQLLMAPLAELANEQQNLPLPAAHLAAGIKVRDSQVLDQPCCSRCSLSSLRAT
jgi:hypothetical protein